MSPATATSAFNFAVSLTRRHHPGPPRVRQLPKVAKCVPNVVLGFLNEGLPYRVPYPKQRQSRNPVPRADGICQWGWFRRNGWLGSKPAPWAADRVLMAAKLETVILSADCRNDAECLVVRV